MEHPRRVLKVWWGRGSISHPVVPSTLVLSDKSCDVCFLVRGFWPANLKVTALKLRIAFIKPAVKCYQIPGVDVGLFLGIHFPTPLFPLYCFVECDTEDSHIRV